MKLKKYFQQRAIITLYFFSILAWFAYFVQGGVGDVLGVYSNWALMTLSLSFVPLMIKRHVSAYVVALCGAVSFGVVELGLNGFAQHFIDTYGNKIAEHLSEDYLPLLAVQVGVWSFATIAVLIKPSFKRGMYYGLLSVLLVLIPMLNNTFDALVSPEVFTLIVLIELAVLSQILGFYAKLPVVNPDSDSEKGLLTTVYYYLAGGVSVVVSLLSVSRYLEQTVFVYVVFAASAVMVIVRLVLNGTMDRGSFVGGVFFILGLFAATFPYWGESVDILASFVQSDGLYIGLYAGLFCLALAAVFCSTVVHASVPVTLLFLLFNFTLGLMAYASKFPFLEATLDVAGFSVVYGSPLEFTIALLSFALISTLVWVKSVDTILSIGMVLASFMGILVAALVYLGAGHDSLDMVLVANLYVEGMGVWSPILLLIIFAFVGVLKRNRFKEISEH